MLLGTAAPRPGRAAVHSPRGNGAPYAPHHPTPLLTKPHHLLTFAHAASTSAAPLRPA